MNPTRTFAVVLRQYYLFRSSPVRILPLFAWVTIDMVLWGYLARYLNGVTAQPAASGSLPDFIPALLGAVLFFDFFSRVMQGVATAFFEDVWARNFLNFFATPLTIADYLGGLLVTGILTSLVALAVMLTLATAVFGLSFAAYGALLVPFLLVLVVFGLAMGIVACAIVLRLGPASEWFIWPIPSLMAPLAGVFYPLSTLPGWLQVVGRVLPLSYVFEGMRTVVAGGEVAGSDLVTAAALTLFYLALASWWFARVYRQAVRSGLIARYSAESVG